MKTAVLWFFTLLVVGLALPCSAQDKVLVYYTYLKAKKPVQKSITFQELKANYQMIRQRTFRPPPPNVFFNDYIRFKLGVEVALNDKQLVTRPNIDTQISNLALRQAFYQELYNAFADMKLQKQMNRLQKTVRDMSSSTLQKLYLKSPEYNIFFIVTNHPLNPNKAQIAEARTRAQKVHAQVIKSKKSFRELVVLYSDDKANGTLDINRTEASIPPEVYAKLKTMKEGQISSPLSVPTGWMIVKLNKKIPFASANQIVVRDNYFQKERSKIFLKFYEGWKKHFKLNVVNKDLVKNLSI